MILFIIHSNAFLQKKCVFPHIWNFTLIFGLYTCLIDGPFLMVIFSLVFSNALNFQAHALQFKLNKVGYTNFAKFRFQSMSFQIEQAFEKRNKPCFGFHFANSNLKYFFLHFLLILFFIFLYFISYIFTKLM